MIPTDVFDSDTTLRWSARGGDYVVWFHWPLMAKEPTIPDFYYLRDGEFLVITDRDVDLPAGFELHPLEVAGRYVAPMMKRVDEGCMFGEPTEGPNLWRVKAGDRLAWVRPADSEAALMRILDFHSCALAYGAWAGQPDLDQFMRFGSLPGQAMSDIDSRACRAAFHAVKELGQPRTLSTEWSFGG